MTYRLQIGKERPLNLVSTYAPTKQITDESKEQFYENLNEIATQIPVNESLVVLGDFNAIIGKDIEAWSDIIGKHGIGKMNLNGEMLLSFCAQHNLVIADTMF